MKEISIYNTSFFKSFVTASIFLFLALGLGFFGLFSSNKLNLFWSIPLVLVTVVLFPYWFGQFFVKPITNIYQQLANTDHSSVASSSLDFKTLSSLVTNQVARYQSLIPFINRINEGDLSEDDRKTIAGDPVLEALDQMRKRMQNTITEISDSVFSAAEKGSLQTRLSTDDKQGVWKEMATSFNSLLKSFSNPLREFNVIITAMSNGDLTKRYRKQEQGDLAVMANNLNAALDHIDGLLHQVSRNASIIEETVSVMKVSSTEMNTSTQEISSSIAEMSNGAHNQVIKVDESSSLLEQLRSSSTSMEQIATGINKTARKGAESSNRGKEMLETLSRGMQETSKVGDQTKESFQALSDRSKEISQVLTVISEITAQTNLLALNAAIEAAQAGEAGRGFAVVADEIRKLAESSKSSAQEIEKLIRDVQKDTYDASVNMEKMLNSVNEGVSASSQVATALEEIFAMLETNLGDSEEITQSAKKQTENINEIVSITENIVVVAEETAAGSEQIAASSSELSSGMDAYNGRMEDLNRIADEFKEGVSMLQLSGNENTKLFKMKEAYEKEKSLLDALLNYMPDYIYFKDMNSRFLRVSKSMTALFKVDSVDDIHGRTDADFFGDHAKKALEDEQRIIETQQPVLNDIEKEDRNDGTVGYVSTTKLPLRDIHEEVIGTFGISRDITEQKETELALSSKAQKLDDMIEENDKLKQQIKELSE
ncbi:MAG: methyl-accepting chemotaxis protein [Bacteroidota bacterium]